MIVSFLKCFRRWRTFLHNNSASTSVMEKVTDNDRIKASLRVSKIEIADKIKAFLWANKEKEI